MSYQIKNIENINNFFENHGLNKVENNTSDTKTVIDIIKNRGDNENVIKAIIKYKINDYFNSDDKDIITFVASRRKEIRKRLDLSLPTVVPSRGAGIVLFIVIILVYSILFYFSFKNLSYSIPFLVFINITVGIPISIFLWEFILFFFPNSIGKNSFPGVNSEDELIDEIYRVNKNKFSYEDYEYLQKVLKGIEMNIPINQI
ncbi:MAG: hypothetical protein ACQETL_09710 [Bacteroidota bacterium]